MCNDSPFLCTFPSFPSFPIAMERTIFLSTLRSRQLIEKQKEPKECVEGKAEAKKEMECEYLGMTLNYGDRNPIDVKIDDVSMKMEKPWEIF